MNNLQWLVCSAFMHKANTQTQGSFLRFLPPAHKKFLASAMPNPALLQGYDRHAELLTWVHYSWWAPFLRTKPEPQIPLYLSTLETTQADKLAKLLLLSKSQIPNPSPIARQFLQKQLTTFLLSATPDLLPKNGVPADPLNTLLELSKDQIRLVIDFLGLYDLSLEIRQVIDTARLKKIYGSLSKEQLLFLNSILHKKQPIAFKKIGITQWDGKPESLLSLLKKRGINRLAKALYSTHPSLIWYVSHRISMEESSLFHSLHTQLEQPGFHKALADQVLEILCFLKKHQLQGLT